MQEALSAIPYVQTQIEEHLPEYSRAVSEMRRELGVYNGQVHSSAHRGVSLLMVQTANDFSDLLADIGMGRGRPAGRGLRSIFESLITMLDITSGGSDTVDRYVEHHAVVMYQAATMEAGLTGLTGNDLRSERHHRRKQQRIHKQAHDAAIAKRGEGFKRRWTEKTLKARAARHGYVEDYNLYGVLSSSVHVSAGGVQGIERFYEGTPVYRFGPDLLACPLALNEGLRYFRLFVESVSAHVGVPAERLIDTLSVLELLRGAYRKLILRIDGDMWPDDLPIGMIVVRALLPDGQRKWLLHDNQQERIIECSSPKNATQQQMDSAEQSLDEWEEEHQDRDEWITIALLEATADPLPHARWRPEGLLAQLDPIRNPYGLILPWDQ